MFGWWLGSAPSARGSNAARTRSCVFVVGRLCPGMPAVFEARTRGKCVIEAPAVTCPPIFFVFPSAVPFPPFLFFSRVQMTYDCQALHGDITQANRESTLAGFKKGSFKVRSTTWAGYEFNHARCPPFLVPRVALTLASNFYGGTAVGAFLLEICGPHPPPVPCVLPSLSVVCLPRQAMPLYVPIAAARTVNYPPPRTTTLFTKKTTPWIVVRIAARTTEDKTHVPDLQPVAHRAEKIIYTYIGARGDGRGRPRSGHGGRPRTQRRATHPPERPRRHGVVRPPLRADGEGRAEGGVHHAVHAAPEGRARRDR